VLARATHFLLPVPTFLWSLHFSSPYLFLAPIFLWPYLSSATTFLQPLKRPRARFESRAGANVYPFTLLFTWGDFIDFSEYIFATA
jgi:hypothetical protein